MFQWLRNLFGRHGQKGGPLKKPYQVEPEQEDRLLSRKLDDNKQVLAEIFDRCERPGDAPDQDRQAGHHPRPGGLF